MEKRMDYRKWLEHIEAMPFEEQREELQRIERQALYCVGGDSDLILKNDVIESKKELDILMHKRFKLLNTMYLATPEEHERMRVVNKRLYELTTQLREALIEVCNGLINTPRSFFTHDFEVRGTIQFVYDDDCSVLPMNIDSKYGSDYQHMMAIQNALLDVEGQSLEMHCRYDKAEESLWNLDDGESWSHDVPVKDPFDGICICHTAAVFVRDLRYPVFDLLHMNDFWSEVEVKYQNFAKAYS